MGSKSQWVGALLDWPIFFIAAILTFCTDREVAERSILIKNMLEDLGAAEEAVPLPNVSIASPPPTGVGIFFVGSK